MTDGVCGHSLQSCTDKSELHTAVTRAGYRSIPAFVNNADIIYGRFLCCYVLHVEMMTFVYPLAWFLLLLAIPIILFYILKVRLQQEPVSTMIFWEQVFEERRSRSFWHRFRHLLSLILCLLFLAGLVGSALEPVSTSQQKAARCVIIVDNSASMNARDARQQTRLDQAKKELHTLLTTTDIARQTAILTAGGYPQIATGFTDHPGTLRQCVESIRPTDYPSALVETIELALQLTATEEESSILVLTDGNTPGLSSFESVPNVRFFPVGEPTTNIGITSFQPRRSLGDAVGYEILVEMVNHGIEPAQARLEIELDDRTIDVIPLTLEPGQPHTAIVRDVTAEGGLLRASLRAIGGETRGTADALPTDDTAIAFLPARPTQQVYIYGEEHFFLRMVMQSQPNINLHFPTDLSQVPADAVLVLHRNIPSDIGTAIPARNVLIIDPRNSCDLFDVGDPLEMPIAAKVSSTGLMNTGLMKFVNLLNLTIPGARTLTLKAGSNVMTENLAETPEEKPIYAYSVFPDEGGGESPGRNILVLTADLDRSDLPLRTAFPILVSQALHHFRGSGGDLEKAYSTGEPISVSLAGMRPDIDRVILRSPSGVERSRIDQPRTDQYFPVKSGVVSLGMLPECGVWELYEPGGLEPGDLPLLRIACNLTNGESSNLRFAPESFYAGTPDTMALRSGIRPIWFWFALAVLLLTVTEWLLYQRRWVD